MKMFQDDLARLVNPDAPKEEKKILIDAIGSSINQGGSTAQNIMESIKDTYAKS